MATKAQIDFIECLAIDLGFDRRTRNTYISEWMGREVRYLDELNKSEASYIINYFKEMKGEGDDDD